MRRYQLCDVFGDMDYDPLEDTYNRSPEEEDHYDLGDIWKAAKRAAHRNYRRYGQHPLCCSCANKCKMPNIPGLKITCPKTPDYVAEARKRGMSIA